MTPSDYDELDLLVRPDGERWADPGVTESGTGLIATMQRVADEIDQLYREVLPAPGDKRDWLHDAMRYAVIGGGKKLRPVLVVAAAELLGVPRASALFAGLAAECVHVNSLIHDDLPCMDDDDLRRGKPTVHRAFDEATAVLAGDALLALAFQILASTLTHPDPSVRAELVGTLAAAAGAYGMAGGQVLDLLAETDRLDLEAVIRLQRLKTGRLFGWCIEAGAILARAPHEVRIALQGYAQCVGLAFQIADDLLDVGGSEADVGKRVKKDIRRGKATFVSLLGEDRARVQARRLVEQAIDHIGCFGKDAHLLHEIAQFSVARTR